MKRRKTGRWKRALLFLLPLTLIVAVLADNLLLRVRSYTLAFPDLPEGFDGLRILQLSDLHGRDGLTGQLLRQAERLEPDLVLITGDLVDGEGQAEHLRPLLAGLCALAPVCYVTGNHEWALRDTESFLSALSDLGIILLRNRFIALEREGDRLLLAGLEDPNAHAERKTPRALAEEMEAAGGGFSLLLVHRPEFFSECAAQGFRLVFSGHVHGGMLRLPFLGGVLAPGHVLFPEYDGGLFTLEGSRMVLSRGLAGVGSFPRLLNPIEVSFVTLKRG